jgi:2-polyprenyl-3-methyl-5-hydroxy-6-metoxy-1,4-benzoquinol methylase
LGLLLAVQGFRVTLLDIRAGHIAYARQRYTSGDVCFHVGRLEEQTFLEPFDLVVLSEVIEHVRSPALLLSEIRHRLRPRGALLITTPNADYLFARQPSFGRAAQAVIDGAEEDSADGDSHRYLFTDSELATVARASGFRVDQAAFFCSFWIEGNLKTRFFYKFPGASRMLQLGIPDVVGRGHAARRLCAGQFLLVRRDS